MGPYPINAVRNIYGLEPTEVTAIGFKTPGREFLKMEYDTISVTLRFPGDRMANFTVGYAAAGSQGYKLVGTKGRSTFDSCVDPSMMWHPFPLTCVGEIEVNPSYGFGSGVKIAYKTKIDGREDSKTFPETDHFGGETEYFSDCILKNMDPEADGEEGLNDVRVILAVKESLDNHGKTVKLESKERNKRPTLDQVKKLPLAKEPKLLVGRDSQKPAVN